ncbi:hypothetical protein QQ045_011160 [Rhodiola kirilowii]
MGDFNYVLRYLPLYRAALTDDWETAEAIFNQDSKADTAKITYLSQTALHIAVGTNNSHDFVDKLVNRIADKDITKLRNFDSQSYNSLHFAAKLGNTKAAKALAEKDRDMTLIKTHKGITAVTLAAMSGHKETLAYLLEVTPNVVGEDGTSPYSGIDGGDLIMYIIIAGFYDIALKFINDYPNLAAQKDTYRFTGLARLAQQSSAFPSGRSWWFWQHFIYLC